MATAETSARTFKLTYVVQGDDWGSEDIAAAYYRFDNDSGLLEFKDDKHAIVFAIPMARVALVSSPAKAVAA